MNLGIHHPLVEFIYQELFNNGVEIVWNPPPRRHSLNIFTYHISYVWTQDDICLLLALWYLLGCPIIRVYIHFPTMMRFPDYVYAALGNFSIFPAHHHIALSVTKDLATNQAHAILTSSPCFIDVSSHPAHAAVLLLLVSYYVK
ncbi:hypothetical protein Scep_024468 [Stephania cephalantha]|uniref:Uncharacterized protein n=1 Tax=Stephania cephalantha TaxID=152367 RepID=A0AAP0HTQ2_9MAGN